MEEASRQVSAVRVVVEACTDSHLAELLASALQVDLQRSHSRYLTYFEAAPPVWPELQRGERQHLPGNLTEEAID